MMMNGALPGCCAALPAGRPSPLRVAVPQRHDSGRAGVSAFVAPAAPQRISLPGGYATRFFEVPRRRRAPFPFPFLRFSGIL